VAAAAPGNLGWPGGAPNFFQRRQRDTFSAGGGGGIRRLRGLWGTLVNAVQP